MQLGNVLDEQEEARQCSNAVLVGLSIILNEWVNDAVTVWMMLLATSIRLLIATPLQPLRLFIIQLRLFYCFIRDSIISVSSCY